MEKPLNPALTTPPGTVHLKADENGTQSPDLSTGQSTGHSTDVVIVGAGPVGLFGIFQCGMLGLRCHVVDTLDHPGGQCTALYPEKPIYDIPGFPKLSASELIDRLEEQARPFAATWHLSQQVLDLTPTDGGRWRVTTSTGAVIDAGAVLIAAGVGAFGPNRPPLAGIESYERSGAVRYAIRRKEDLRDRHVVIAGGGDSAVDWALDLAGIAASVSLVHRRDKFRAAPDSISRLRDLARSGRIDLVIPYQLAAIDGDGARISAVVVSDPDGASRALPADILIPQFGLAMSLGPIAGWGLGIERGRIPINPGTAETRRPGLYAIGDIATYPHKLKLILTGFSEAAAAANAIYRRLNPETDLHFEYSTTKGIPV